MAANIFLNFDVFCKELDLAGFGVLSVAFCKIYPIAHKMRGARHV
jgi:hypothetical protein